MAIYRNITTNAMSAKYSFGMVSIKPVATSSPSDQLHVNARQRQEIFIFMQVPIYKKGRGSHLGQ
jgi:hypothetical protein